MYNQSHVTLQKDEIDLREVGMSLIKRKKTILFTAIIATLLTTIYTWTLAPTYSGTVFIEIGEIIFNGDPLNDKETIIQPLDNVNNIEVFISENQKLTDGVKVNVPKGSTNLLQLTYENSDPKAIQEHLEKTADLVLERHAERSLFYQKANTIIRPTQIISSFNISSDQTKTKKQLIITSALIIGLIIGILLAFFLESVKTIYKKEEQ